MRQDKKAKLICIVGPTATGKTRLAVELALKYNGEVVSADSMQIYKGMDIGTAKPTAAERMGVPHHMMDIVSSFESYSVARYTAEASDVIEKIYSGGKLPIVAGGTGLYIDSLLRNMDFAAFDGDKEYRSELNRLAKREGPGAVHRMLFDIDPESAVKLHENDLKRVIRALEVYKITGETQSAHIRRTKKYGEKYDVLYLGLNFSDREKLYDRINMRVDAMMEAGLLDEVKRLIADGVPTNSTALQAIGYKELIRALEDNLPVPDAVNQIKQNSRRYAKRQITWFKRNANINWIYVDEKDICGILQASSVFTKKFDIM
jgi:tRNA dimethylallyltransferase